MFLLCYRFSFSIPNQEIGLRNVSEMTYFCVEWDVKPQLNQSTRMWANAQRGGRPVEYRWRPLFDALKFGWRPLRVTRSNAAKKRKPLKFAGVPKLANRSQPSVGRSSPCCEDIWRRYRCLTSFFYSAPQCSHCKRCTSYSNSVCLSVCLSVRLSVTRGIVSKRRHVARCSLHRWIAKCV